MMRFLCAVVVDASFFNRKNGIEIQNDVCMILALIPVLSVWLHLIAPIKCLQWTHINFRHIIQIVFGVQNYLPLSRNNHNNTTHLEIFYDV